MALATGKPPPGRAALLLYLNESTFHDPLGTVAATIKQAINLNVPIAMAHEQDHAKGGCAFRLIYEQAPRELQLRPYRLFDTMAVALYTTPEHRKTSVARAWTQCQVSLPKRS